MSSSSKQINHASSSLSEQPVPSLDESQVAPRRPYYRPHVAQQTSSVALPELPSWTVLPEAGDSSRPTSATETPMPRAPALPRSHAQPTPPMQRQEGISQSFGFFSHDMLAQRPRVPVSVLKVMDSETPTLNGSPRLPTASDASRRASGATRTPREGLHVQPDAPSPADASGARFLTQTPIIATSQVEPPVLLESRKPNTPGASPEAQAAGSPEAEKTRQEAVTRSRVESGSSLRTPQAGANGLGMTRSASLVSAMNSAYAFNAPSAPVGLKTNRFAVTAQDLSPGVGFGRAGGPVTSTPFVSQQRPQMSPPAPIRIDRPHLGAHDGLEAEDADLEEGTSFRTTNPNTPRPPRSADNSIIAALTAAFQSNSAQVQQQQQQRALHAKRRGEVPTPREKEAQDLKSKEKETGKKPDARPSTKRQRSPSDVEAWRSVIQGRANRRRTEAVVLDEADEQASVDVVTVRQNVAQGSEIIDVDMLTPSPTPPDRVLVPSEAQPPSSLPPVTPEKPAATAHNASSSPAVAQQTQTQMQMRSRLRDPAPSSGSRIPDLDTLLNTQTLSVSYEPDALASPTRASLLLQSRPEMYLCSAGYAKYEGDRYTAPWAGKTRARYSEAGMFKQRLDALFGRGSMLRGFGRRPEGAGAGAGGDLGERDELDLIDTHHHHRRHSTGTHAESTDLGIHRQVDDARVSTSQEPDGNLKSHEVIDVDVDFDKDGTASESDGSVSSLEMRKLVMRRSQQISVSRSPTKTPSKPH